MDYRAGKDRRLTRRDDIRRVFDGGRRAADAMLTLYAAPNDLSRPRLGVGVSGRHGGAVKRNRVKRLCREAFRLVRNELPAGYDFMMIPRPGHEFTLEKLQQSLLKLSAKVVPAEDRK